MVEILKRDCAMSDVQGVVVSRLLGIRAADRILKRLACRLAIAFALEQNLILDDGAVQVARIVFQDLRSGSFGRIVFTEAVLNGRERLEKRELRWRGGAVGSGNRQLGIERFSVSRLREAV